MTAVHSHSDPEIFIRAHAVITGTRISVCIDRVRNCCIWLTSLVLRVIRESTENLSTSPGVNSLTLSNSFSLRR